jgi:uncharacterized glyoxalase superfamily protein PhnB
VLLRRVAWKKVCLGPRASPSTGTLDENVALGNAQAQPIAMSRAIDKTDIVGKKRLHAAYPMVFVTDVAQAAEYYKTKLAFKVDYLYGEPPFYGMVTRDGASLHLRHVDRHPLDRTEKDLLTASIPVEGIESLFLEFQASGVEFHQTLQRQPWGTSDFIVKDSDGNLLNFAGAKAD